MKKLCIYSIVICTTTLSHHACRQNEQAIFTPENTIILWDLNGVVLKADGCAMASEFWRCNHICSIFWNGLATGIHLVRTLGTKKACFEEIIQACESVNPYLAELMRSMSSHQKLISGTAAIIEELYAKGYTLAIATNMGIKTFEMIKKNYEPFFDYFSLITTVDTIDLTETLIEKADPQFFALYQKLYNKEGKQIIFIDDDTYNVTAAQAAGMQAILFKNFKQLRHELQKLRLLSVA